MRTKIDNPYPVQHFKSTINFLKTDLEINPNTRPRLHLGCTGRAFVTHLTLRTVSPLFLVPAGSCEGQRPGWYINIDQV